MPSSRAIYKLHPVTMWQTTPAYVTALAPHCALPPFTCIRSNAKRCGSPFLHQAQACTSHSVKSAACVAAAQAQQLQDVTDMKEQGTQISDIPFVHTQARVTKHASSIACMHWQRCAWLRHVASGATCIHKWSATLQRPFSLRVCITLASSLKTRRHPGSFIAIH